MGKAQNGISQAVMLKGCKRKGAQVANVYTNGFTMRNGCKVRKGIKFGGMFAGEIKRGRRVEVVRSTTEAGLEMEIIKVLSVMKYKSQCY